MAASTQNRRTLRFNGFEVDPRSRELRRNGSHVRLQDQPLEVLLLLLERQGEVVTREELKDKLWPAGTFVDSDDGLNTAIKKLRDVLHDSLERPRYIETIPRRGYRFIGKLDTEEPTVSELSVESPEVHPPVSTANTDDDSKTKSSEPQHDPSTRPESKSWQHSRPTWLKIGTGIVAISAILFAAVVVYRWSWRQVPQQRAASRPLPFTTLPGVETSPAFSPDGSRIAFAWNGDPANGGKGYDLYVKAFGSETLLRLTQHPSQMISPAWSPDGTQIAFHRMAGADTGIYVVPALGGPERKVRSTYLSALAKVPIDWSPDGKWIAFSDSLPGERTGTMSLLSTATWEVKRLPSPPKCLVAGIPAFSHSGDYLAFWCFHTEEEYGLYSIPLQGGPPKLISVFRPFPTGLTWSGDDKALIYSISGELSEVTLASGSVKRFDFLGSAVLPALSPKGDKLAFSSSSNGSNLWRMDLLHLDSPPVELMPSTRSQDEAQYSPDGKRIAFESVRSGVLGVWISDNDGSNLVQISNPQIESGSPQWSPDGKRIAFNSRASDRSEIEVADLSERIPRKLVTNISDVTRPTWSRDGRWIYFMSNEVGKTGIHRCPAWGGDSVALSNDPRGVVAHESFDGKTVYFANHGATPALKQVSLVALPGMASELKELPRVSAALHWTVSREGIFFVPADAPRSLRYFDFATKHVRRLFDAEMEFGDGLSISPDGRWIIYAQLENANGDIMLVDHFQ
jgi:Tol biopolymer transport system component/DNA-binding winged helix-turn-helix (wHTH) protein